MTPINIIVINAAIGSTAPDKTPNTNVFSFLIPHCLNGKDIMAPSGKFCIAIPIDSAIAIEIGTACETLEKTRR